MVNKNMEGAFLLLNMSSGRMSSVPEASSTGGAVGEQGALMGPEQDGKKASFNLKGSKRSSDGSGVKPTSSNPTEVSEVSEPDSQVEMQEMMSGRLLELMPEPKENKKEANKAVAPVTKTQKPKLKENIKNGSTVMPPAGYPMHPQYPYMGYPPYVPYGYAYPVPFYPPQPQQPQQQGYPAHYAMYARPPLAQQAKDPKTKDISAGNVSKIVAKINGQGESSDEEPASKKIKSTVKTGEKGFFIPRKSIPESSTGRRVIIYGYRPDATIDQVKECFKPCGNIVQVSFVPDSSIPEMKHAALVFEFDNGASNAVQLAKIVDLPKLGGRVTAVLADDKFTLSGRLLRIDFGQQIPFDDKAKTGLSVTFGKPLKLTQNGQLIELFYAKPQEAQKALTKAQQMRLNAQLV